MLAKTIEIFLFSAIWGSTGLVAGAMFAFAAGGNLWPLTGILVGAICFIVAFAALGSYWLMKWFRLL
ncbi:hypothetical protein JM93_00935 [Roseibium hamelinense]|uniref:Uncharacterized protein n=1 Tax=Roseibium hamelinense TaxID=150831 RepID=A0A562TI50_9HYPH|nr:hypothetical protein [Roseibium hamelinense]MTI42632.1 hypothetical protein [Roseibium hamelinense]TWI93379.1 hypothetical protein JM93_00935 [Roseibium hamelinense]